MYIYSAIQTKAMFILNGL